MCYLWLDGLMAQFTQGEQPSLVVCTLANFHLPQGIQIHVASILCVSQGSTAICLEAGGGTIKSSYRYSKLFYHLSMHEPPHVLRAVITQRSMLVKIRFDSLVLLFGESVVFPSPGIEKCSYLKMDCVDVTLFMRIYRASNNL